MPVETKRLYWWQDATVETITKWLNKINEYKAHDPRFWLSDEFHLVSYFLRENAGFIGINETVECGFSLTDWGKVYLRQDDKWKNEWLSEFKLNKVKREREEIDKRYESNVAVLNELLEHFQNEYNRIRN